jgi:hypothetical protein
VPAVPGPARPARPEPPRRRPDPTGLRTLIGFAGIASASAIATALLPSVAPLPDAAAAGGLVADAAVATADVVAAPSVRHVTRFVTLKPGQTAPPQAQVIVQPTPTPRVHVVTRTRQSGRP